MRDGCISTTPIVLVFVNLDGYDFSSVVVVVVLAGWPPC